MAFADEQAMDLAKSFLSDKWKTADKALNSFVLKHVPTDFVISFMENYL